MAETKENKAKEKTKDQPEEPWQPRTMPAQLIIRAARLLGRIDDTRLRELGVSVSQLPVIASLKNGERRTQKELARLTGVEQPSMAQLLARMERDGLVRREPDPVDGRSSLISLTDHAMALLAPGRRILSQGNREALAGFTKNEIDLLVAMLRRVIANVSDGGRC